jgi:hypothetical protein
VSCYICEKAEGELDALSDDRKVRVCVACFLYETQGASVVPGFGDHVEVVRGATSLFQGTPDMVREWAELGCPSDAQEYERLKAAKRGYWS